MKSFKKFVERIRPVATKYPVQLAVGVSMILISSAVALMYTGVVTWSVGVVWTIVATIVLIALLGFGHGLLIADWEAYQKHARGLWLEKTGQQMATVNMKTTLVMFSVMVITLLTTFGLARLEYDGATLSAIGMVAAFAFLAQLFGSVIACTALTVYRVATTEPVHRLYW